jgi:ABC-type nitrate/sulfonate/bicarbonate transport system substrate-binding protein
MLKSPRLHRRFKRKFEKHLLLSQALFLPNACGPAFAVLFWSAMRFCYVARRGSIMRIHLVTLLAGLLCPTVSLAQNAEKAIITHTSESISLAPLLYGIEKGFYRKEGIDLDFRILRTDLASAAIVGSKEVDYMYSAGTALRVAARGLPIRVVAYTLKNILFYLMAQPTIRSVPELKHKKIAVALPSDTGGLATKAVLKASGLDPEKDATYIAIGAASVRLAAMEAGSIDASIMPVPWNIRMRQKGFRELAFAGNYVKEPLTGFAASTEKLERQPQQVKKVLTGFLRSIDAFRSDRKDAVEFIERRFRLDLPIAAESYRIVIESLSEDGTISDQSLQEYVEQIKKEPGVKKQITVSDLVDFRILREAKRDMGRK